MQVAYDQLSLGQQLLARQGEHAGAVRSYIGANCSISSDMGYLLVALAPLASLSVVLGQQAATAVGSLCTAGSAAAQASLTGYIEADNAAQQDFVAISSSVGGIGSSFSAPSLGGAESQAGGDYGSGSDWIFGKAEELGRGARELVDGTLDTAGDRLEGWTGGSAGVSERSDPSSYLVTPDAGGNFVQDLRWSAGLILGGLDWVAEFFIGFSVLEEAIFKPFGGDWEAMNRASVAWSHSGRAFMEMSSNISALPEQMSSWQGEAADAFRAAMAALSGAVVGVSYAFDYVSGLVANVELVSKMACSAIAMIMGFIASNLMILAAEAAVPVIGWAAAAAHVVVIVGYVVSALKIIYTLIDAILAAIEDFIAAKEKLVQVIFVVEDIVEYSAKSALGAR
jgi:hypothetical protein